MHRRISRRSLLAKSLFTGIGVTGLALIGCGEDEPDPQQRRPSARPADDQPQPARRDTAAPTASPAARADPQPVEEEQGAADVLSQLPVATVVDPLEWRERFHWRKLRNAPGRPAQPQRGGELSFQTGLLPYGNWNPLRPQWSYIGGGLLPLFYSQLVELVADDGIDAHRNMIAGDLADAWEAPDEQTIVFTIARGVIWPQANPFDSRELTVEDVRAAHEAYRDPAMLQSPPYRDVERIEADAGANTVTFRLSAPNAAMLNQMTSPWHVILREEIVSAPDLWDLADTPIGTGPFALDNWSEYGSMRAVRNPTYFKRDRRGEPLPYLDSVRGRPGSITVIAGGGNTAMLSSWEYGGGIDQVHLSTPELWHTASDAHPNSITQVSPPTPGEGLALSFKSLSEPPFDDPRVRTALSRSIDRELLAQRVYGGLAASDCGHNWTFVADASSESGFREWPWSLDELGEAFVPDAQAARQLLSAAGYTAAQPLAIRLDAPPDLSSQPQIIDDRYEGAIEVVEHGLRDSLGDAATIELARRTVATEGQGNATSYRVSPNPDLNIWFRQGFESYAVDPDDLITTHLEGSEIHNPVGQEIAEAQRRALDPLERSDLLEQIRHREAEEVWRLHLVNPYGLSVRREYVFDKVDTYFAKSIEQRPRQLERVWRST